MTELGPIFDRLGLGQYLERFLDEGFETWETVLDITESDLDALAVKLGHRRRLQREIANTRAADVDEIATFAAKSPLEHEAQPGTDDHDGPSTVDGSRRPKRKYRRHPKADGHAPDRTQSAYVIFSNKVRDDLKPKILSFTDIAKRVGEMWQALAPDEREPFEAQAGSAKEEYMAELAQYKQTDNFKEYSEYLANFKATHPYKADGKKPKLESQASTASSSSTRSQANSAEPQGRNVSQWSDQSSSRAIPDTRQESKRRTAELMSPITSNHSFPSSRTSPTPSVASLTSSSQSAFPTNVIRNPKALQPPHGIDPLRHGPITSTSSLPSITAPEPRDPSSTQSSKSWFGYHPSSSVSNTSPLSDYRRSYHPPPSFIHAKSTSSSTSRSHSSDQLEATVQSNRPREESQARRPPPTSSRGQHTSYMEGVESSSGSNDPLESRVQSIYGQSHQAESPHNSSLSSFSLNVGTPNSHHHINSSTRHSTKSPYHCHSSHEVLPRMRKKDEYHDGVLRSDADPLAVLAYAGDILDRTSRQAC